MDTRVLDTQGVDECSQMHSDSITNNQPLQMDLSRKYPDQHKKRRGMNIFPSSSDEDDRGKKLVPFSKGPRKTQIKAPVLKIHRKSQEPISNPQTKSCSSITNNNPFQQGICNNNNNLGDDVYCFQRNSIQEPYKININDRKKQKALAVNVQTNRNQSTGGLSKLVSAQTSRQSLPIQSIKFNQNKDQNQVIGNQKLNILLGNALKNTENSFISKIQSNRSVLSVNKIDMSAGYSYKDRMRKRNVKDS